MATEGVWVVYDHDQGPFAVSVHPTPEAAIIGLHRAGYGKVAFWEYGVDLAAGIRAWDARNAEAPT